MKNIGTNSPILTNEVKEEIVNHSIENTQQEVCGLIVKTDTKFIVCRCNNIAKNKEKHFRIEPSDYLTASKLGKIVAIYHTHISDTIGASSFDVFSSSLHKLPFITYNVKSNNFSMIDGQEYSKYLDKDFQIGINDCFSLVSEFYLDKFNIKLNNYNRQDGWYKSDPEVFLRNYRREGFGKSDELKKYNILLLKLIETISFPHHMAIYLGDDTILHHPRDKKSIIEPYSKRYKEATYLILEHGLLNK